MSDTRILITYVVKKNDQLLRQSYFKSNQFDQDLNTKL